MILKKLLNQKDQNYLFVFFVVNPISTVVTRLLIDTLNLTSKNILIVSFRNTDLALLNYNSYIVNMNKLDRVYEKITFSSISGKRIIKKIKNKNFILFASWSYREVNYLINHSNCQGHYYIEEGQGSYRFHPEYSYKSVSLKKRILNNFKNRVNNAKKDDLSFRDDSLGYIGISNKSFPQIPPNKKVNLYNIKDLKKVYNNRLSGVKYIGLTYAERRLNNIQWQDMISKLIQLLPENSVIKAHPSFMINSEKIESLEKFINKISKGKIHLCPKDVIIEMEMQYEKKIVIGPSSSLEFYTKLFKSEYQKIDYIK